MAKTNQEKLTAYEAKRERLAKEREAQQAKSKAAYEAKAKARVERQEKEKAAREAEKTRYKSLSPKEKKAEDRKRASEAEKKQIEEIKAKVQKRYDLSRDEERLLKKSQLLENPLLYKEGDSRVFKDPNEYLEFYKKYEDLKAKDTAEKKKTDPYLLMDQLSDKRSQELYKKTLANFGGKLDKREIDTLLAYDQALDIAKNNTRGLKKNPNYANILADTEYELTQPVVQSLDYLLNLKKENEQQAYWRNFDREHNTALYLNELADIDDFIKNPDQYRQTYAYAQDYDVDLQDQIARRGQVQRELASLRYQGPERTSPMPNYAPVALAAEPVVSAPVTQPSSMTTAKTEPQGLAQVLAQQQEAGQQQAAQQQGLQDLAYQPQQQFQQVQQPTQQQTTGLASLPPQRMSQAEIDAYGKTYNAYNPTAQISQGAYDPALEQKLGMTLNQVLQPNTTTTMKRGGHVKPKVPVKKKSGYVPKSQSKTASRRGDGIAQRGKTRGRMV